jgi:hypothetical protein
LELSNKTLFLFSLQGIGAIFVGVFLAAYLAGLPTTAVFHSEPAFRFPLMFFGAILLILILCIALIAVFQKK